MGKKTSFATYARWLKEYCRKNSQPFVKDSGNMIGYCFDLEQKIPDKYGWRFSSVESLKRQVEANPLEHNSIYWLDQARNVEAYSTMTLWRCVELLRSAIRSLNVHEVIPPAVLARSLLELATVFLINANTIEKSFRELSFPANTTVVSTELEALIIKMIWGTRYDNPEPHVQQVNILTYLKKLSKHPAAEELMPTYEYLCDVAHPSFIGNTRYWSHTEKVYRNGSEFRVISKGRNREAINPILDRTLWSLGWSAATVRNSFEIMSSGINQLLFKVENS